MWVLVILPSTTAFLFGNMFGNSGSNCCQQSQCAPPAPTGCSSYPPAFSPPQYAMANPIQQSQHVFPTFPSYQPAYQPQPAQQAQYPVFTAAQPSAFPQVIPQHTRPQNYVQSPPQPLPLPPPQHETVRYERPPQPLPSQQGTVRYETRSQILPQTQPIGYGTQQAYATTSERIMLQPPNKDTYKTYAREDATQVYPSKVPKSSEFAEPVLRPVMSDLLSEVSVVDYEPGSPESSEVENEKDEERKDPIDFSIKSDEEPNIQDLIEENSSKTHQYSISHKMEIKTSKIDPLQPIEPTEKTPETQIKRSGLSIHGLESKTPKSWVNPLQKSMILSDRGESNTSEEKVEKSGYDYSEEEKSEKSKSVENFLEEVEEETSKEPKTVNLSYESIQKDVDSFQDKTLSKLHDAAKSAFEDLNSKTLQKRDESISKCNSARLMNLMHEKMNISPAVSKQMIYSAAAEMFPGRNVDVICSRHSFSYIVVTSPIFCEHRKRPLTCFTFFQP